MSQTAQSAKETRLIDSHCMYIGVRMSSMPSLSSLRLSGVLKAWCTYLASLNSRVLPQPCFSGDRRSHATKSTNDRFGEPTLSQANDTERPLGSTASFPLRWFLPGAIGILGG